MVNIADQQLSLLWHFRRFPTFSSLENVSKGCGTQAEIIALGQGTVKAIADYLRLFKETGKRYAR